MSFLADLVETQRFCGWPGVSARLKARVKRQSQLTPMHPEGFPRPVFLRVPSTDAPTYEQIFIHNSYDFTANREPKVIVDAGANIGLAAVLFAHRYPKAKIFALEPDRANFEVMKRNVWGYHNVIPLCAALWNEVGTIRMHDPGLGEWGYMTTTDGEGSEVPAVTVDSLMADYRIDRIDILKIDIEGAEKEVFQDPSRWISRVDSMIVELHDRMKAGCSRTFYRATEGFGAEWLRGENVYLSRGAISPA